MTSSILSNAGKPKDDPYLTAMIFGPSKTGKTTLAASGTKTLILDVEGGTKSVRDTDADVLPIRTWKDFEAAVNDLITRPHDYETVVLDSVTYLQELAGQDADLMGHIMSEKKDPRQAYGKMNAMMRHRLIQLHNARFHFIMTAQLRERDGEDVEAGKYPLTPDVSPAIMKVCIALPDLICRTAIVRKGSSTQDVEYRVIFGPETRSQVGNRDLDLPYDATGVTLTKLIEIYQKGSK